MTTMALTWFLAIFAMPLLASAQIAAQPPPLPTSIVSPYSPEVFCSPYWRSREVRECNARGRCQAPYGTCICDPGFGGPDCSQRLDPCGGRGSQPLVIGSAFGHFTDGYTVSGEYTDKLNCTWILTPTTTAVQAAQEQLPYTIVVDFVDLEEGYDWLYIFDGNAVDQKKLLAAFSGRYPIKTAKDFEPLPQAVLSPTGGAITVQFVADVSTTLRGFSLHFARAANERWLQHMQHVGLQERHPVKGNDPKYYSQLWRATEAIAGKELTKSIRCPIANISIEQLDGTFVVELLPAVRTVVKTSQGNSLSHNTTSVKIELLEPLNQQWIASTEWFEADCLVKFTATKPDSYILTKFYDPTGRGTGTTQLRDPHHSSIFNVLPAISSPSACEAAGKGLDKNNATYAGTPETFVVTARDHLQNQQLIGGDNFRSLLVRQHPPHANLYSWITNMGDGTYRVEYNATVSGRYNLAVNLENGVSNRQGASIASILNSNLGIRGSPFSIWVSSGPIEVSQTKVIGHGLRHAIAGYSSLFVVRLTDVFGNLASGNDNVTVFFEAEGIPSQATPTRPSSKVLRANVSFIGEESLQGDYLADWAPLVAAPHQVYVMLDGQTHVPGSPFQASVQTAPPFSKSTIAFGQGLQDGIAGGARSFNIRDRDWFNNNRTEGFTSFEVSIDGISLRDCPFIQEDTLHEVLCRCPGLASLDMSQCTQGPKVTSSNNDPQIVKHYYRQDSNTLFADDIFKAWAQNSVLSTSCNGLYHVIKAAGLNPADGRTPPEKSLTSEFAGVQRSFNTSDRLNGIYDVNFLVTRAGLYQITAKYFGHHIKDSPFSFTVKPDVFDKSIVDVTGNGLQRITSGHMVMFNIRMRDRFGNYLWKGGHQMQISLQQGMWPCLCALPVNLKDRLPITPGFTQQTLSRYGDGTYRFDYQVSIAGNYPLWVIADGSHLAGSPYNLDVYPGTTAVQTSSAFGSGLRSCGAGLICTFSVQTRDSFGNERVLDTGQDYYEVSVHHKQGLASSSWRAFKDASDLYSTQYNLTVAGDYDLWITNFGVHIDGSPFALSIFGGLTTPFTCTAVGDGLQEAVVGHPGTFTVRARDRFGNGRTSGGEDVQVFMHGQSSVSTLIVDNGDGSYLTEFNVTTSGQYTLAVAILGQDIPGSPFTMIAHGGFVYRQFNSSRGLNLAGSAKYVSGDEGILLTPAEKNYAGAMWFAQQQYVANGFETSMEVQLQDQSKHCKMEVVLEERCVPRGGDGFAFVIRGSKDTLGGPAEQLGYGGLSNSIAVEFDSWFNVELGDPYENHLAVQTAGVQPNEAHHRRKTAGTVRLPRLNDGYKHIIKIRYEPLLSSKHSRLDDFNAAPSAVKWIHHGAGVLQVWVDDLRRPVLTTPLNVSSAIDVADGHAFVGITASTGTAYQRHHILSWTFTDSSCPNSCSGQGVCYLGVCHCEAAYSGTDCSHLRTATHDEEERLRQLGQQYGDSAQGMQAMQARSSPTTAYEAR